ncbi:aminotransferase class III [Haloarcula rubripromontorii]|uniref:Aminotransferase class III n=1 Tax=Haloarcula rubripromontorii TaxID=1705562 RepID=A0A0M9AIC9_9EURY|nr:diaminobutyrate--2-oxoglutarate transaminase family protein [Haloarcula rubripromontorii]KOX92677.1 aminotransferase class III [Haloarcula rubripromontorii]
MRYDESNEKLRTSQQERESSARTYPRSLPFAVDHAQGLELRDADGNTYLDCLAGAGTLVLGHNHPKVTQEVERLLTEDRPLHTLDITTPEKEAFVDAVFESLPDEFTESAKIQFCSPAGTDAVEAAIKLVKTATGNKPVLGFQGGYHGMTNGALSLMGDKATKEPVQGLMPGTHHLPFPDPYRHPFGLDGQNHQPVTAFIERVLTDPKSGVTSPAGMIFEPVQGEGGVNPAPEEWIRDIRRLTRQEEIPLIVDEIQSGMGRTGEMWAFEHADIIPDVVTCSKGIGGGLPLAVVIYDDSLDEWEPGAHAGTFRGHQLAMAAGRATIREILDNDLDDHAAQMGERFLTRLQSLESQFERIGDVRGRGLMLGVEFVDEHDDGDDPPDPNGDLAAAVKAECFERQLVIETGGRDSAVARFLPPLTVSPNEIDEVATRFEEAVTTVLG